MTKHILLPLALTLAMASLLPACGADPLEEKEIALARKAATEGVLTTTQHYDFTQWLETPDGYSLPTIGKGDTPTATTGPQRATKATPSSRRVRVTSP